MNEYQLEDVEKIIQSAVSRAVHDSPSSETINLIGELKEEIKCIKEGQIKAITDTIKVVVNGKIDKLHEILEKQNESMSTYHDKLDRHIENDDIFKARVTPYIESFESAHRMGKVAIFWGGVITTVGAAILVIKSFISFR